MSSRRDRSSRSSSRRSHRPRTISWPSDTWMDSWARSWAKSNRNRGAWVVAVLALLVALVVIGERMNAIDYVNNFIVARGWAEYPAARVPVPAAPQPPRPAPPAPTAPGQPPAAPPVPPLVASVPILPDLAIENVTWYPEVPADGEVIAFEVTVRNLGGAIADITNLSYSIDGPYPSSKIDLLPGVLPGDSSVGTLVWIAEAGSHEITVSADSSKLIDEAEEANNSLTVSITVVDAASDTGATVSADFDTYFRETAVPVPPRAAQSAVIREFGSDWRVADWYDVLLAWDQFAEDMKTAFQGGGRQPHLTVGGVAEWEPGRWYFIEDHDGDRPFSFLSHGELGGHELSLGSWSRDPNTWTVMAVRRDFRASLGRPDEFGDSLTDPMPVSAGQTLHGDIELPGDIDVFAFAAWGGFEYTLETALDSNRDVMMVLYDTEGRYIAHDTPGGGGPRLEWTAPADGEYYLEVRGAAYANVGTYSLSLSDGRPRDRMTIVSGVIGNAEVDPADPVVTVESEGSLIGSVTISLDNNNQPGVVFPLGVTPSWGINSQRFWEIDDHAPGATTTIYIVDLDLTAPTEPGEHAIISAAAAEETLSHVMSATRSTVGDPVWGDGDDIADWGPDQLSAATLRGWVDTPPYPAEPAQFAAAVVRIIVSNNAADSEVP